jgi:hypothetical protein
MRSKRLEVLKKERRKKKKLKESNELDTWWGAFTGEGGTRGEWRGGKWRGLR